MANTLREHLILGRPFLASSRGRIKVLEKELSLGYSDDKVVFRMDKTLCLKPNEVISSCMADKVSNKEPSNFPDNFPPSYFCHLRDNESSDEDDSDNSSLVEDDGVQTSPRMSDKKGVTIVKGKLHCCADITSLMEGSKITLPMCSPFLNCCNGGGHFFLKRIKKAAEVWWCFEDEKLIKENWFQGNHIMANWFEDVGWTIHLCEPVIRMSGEMTQAWPTCDSRLQGFAMEENSQIPIGSNVRNGYVLMKKKERTSATRGFHSRTG